MKQPTARNVIWLIVEELLFYHAILLSKWHKVVYEHYRIVTQAIQREKEIKNLKGIKKRGNNQWI